MTALGYGSDDETLFKKFWPADLHLVGKEIIRFHCVYWPAFLLALNPKLQHKSDEKPPSLSLEEHKAWAEEWLPKAITAHGWLLFEDSKMSKSKGNIVRTETILDAFGNLVYASIFPTSTHAEQDLFASDVLRYFLLREIPFGQDGSFSFDALITRYNADLANGYGNLVSRTLNLINQGFGGEIPENEPASSEEWPYFVMIRPMINEQMDSLSFTNANTNIMNLISVTDDIITKNAPWKLIKSETTEDRQKAARILRGCCEAVRIITALLYPILPYATAKVWKQLGFEKSIEQAAADGELKNLQWGGLKPGTKLGPLGPIFPRADKGLAQIMTDMENPAPHTSENPRRLAENQISTTPSTDPAAPPRTTSPSEHGPLPASAILANQPTPPTTDNQQPTTPQIAIDDFAKIELRVAQILVAERIPKADKLLRLEVDLGPHGKRQILSGIAEWYTPEDLIGRRIVVITNLAPRKMRGLESHGMLLAASDGEAGKPVLATFGEDIALGSRLK